MSSISTATPTEHQALPIPGKARLTTTYLTLLRWAASQIGAMLPLIIVVQVMLAAGIVVGFGLLIPNIDTATARFLATGAPTVLLMVLGFVMVPQGVAQARTSGTFTYQRSLPVPRPLLLAAELTLWTAVALPSVAMAVVMGRIRFDFSYSFNWPLLLAAALLITVTAASVGYALAVSMPPLLAQLMSQVLVFFVMLFSPIAFPASQLPSWFQTLHDYLPFAPAADLLRAGLVSDVYSWSGQDLTVLLVWSALGITIALRALMRRA